MAFSETFADDLTVVVGTPTKASEYNNLSNNTDALKERFVIGHHFNNTGVTNEDGFHKGARTDPTWFYDDDKSLYFMLRVSTASATALVWYVGTTTAAPTATQGEAIVSGTF